MDRGAWQATVGGGHKELDTTDWLTLTRVLDTCWDSYIYLIKKNVEDFDGGAEIEWGIGGRVTAEKKSQPLVISASLG